MTVVIQSDHGRNLSEAWAKALVECWNSHNNVLAQQMVCFDVAEEDSSWDLETLKIRRALEEQLDEFGIRSANQSNIETVAGTIFPESIWKRCQGDREKLFKEYDQMWPRIEKCASATTGEHIFDA